MSAIPRWRAWQEIETYAQEVEAHSHHPEALWWSRRVWSHCGRTPPMELRVPHTCHIHTQVPTLRFTHRQTQVKTVTALLSHWTEVALVCSRWNVLFWSLNQSRFPKLYFIYYYYYCYLKKDLFRYYSFHRKTLCLLELCCVQMQYTWSHSLNELT